MRPRELCGGIVSPQQFTTNLRGFVEQLLAIPAEMFARNPDSGLLPIEAVNGIEMREDHITHLGTQQWLRCNSEKKMIVDSAEDPWRAVTRAADHYSVGSGEIKYLASF